MPSAGILTGERKLERSMMRLQCGNDIDRPDWEYLQPPTAKQELDRKERAMQRFDLMLLNLANRRGGFRGSHLTIGQMGGTELIKEGLLLVIKSDCYEKTVKATTRGRRHYERLAAPIGEW
jgi:hypothetical protein